MVRSLAFLTLHTPPAIYCSSGTRNQRFHNTAVPAALHRAVNTGFVKVLRHIARQNSSVNSPAISVVSRWLCRMPVKPSASQSQPVPGRASSKMRHSPYTTSGRNTMAVYSPTAPRTKMLDSR